jgi:LytS/YehU family sensor histidine kinase
MWTMSSAFGAIAYLCFVLYRASEIQRGTSLRLHREAEALSTLLAKAELALLEAQIEPHFLFNTLAHVKRQYRIDANAADHMLAALIEYLDRALPALRRADWTLGDELDLIRVYQDILVQRFGTRLQFSITCSDTYHTFRIPALTIATLVENAVRHGVAPKTEGGSISIHTERVENALFIEVCDDGVGLQYSSGKGLGLATVRARLRSAFGDKSLLLIEQRQPNGVRAEIRIPIDV